MKKFNKTIGILGGMGPLASSNTYAQLLLLAQKHYNSVQDHEYPHIILNSIDLQGLDETGIADKKIVLKRIIAELKILKKAGSDFIFIACNTVFLLHKKFSQEIKIPIINLIEITCKEVKENNCKKVGLLCSATTNRLKLYQDPLNNLGIKVLAPSQKEQKIIDKTILHVMGGKHTKNDFHKLRKICQKFLNNGAEAIILGCTELPIIINESNIEFKIFNSVNIALKHSLNLAK